MMKLAYKAITILGLFSIITSQLFARAGDSTSIVGLESQARMIFQNLKSDDLTIEAFSNAYIGYRQLLHENIVEKKNILTIIDFNKSSKEERFFIIDISKQSVIHESLVAHGKNSGWDIPTSFSNIPNTNKSSLGFYLTGETYVGKHGLSLKLDGLEEGINDNARKRHIVIHEADYVSDEFVNKIGRLGRSFGCPSLPDENYNQVINLIKNKSLLFIYAEKDFYFDMSNYL